MTKATAPPNTVSFDQTTNCVNSAWYQHDANGNMTAMPGANNLTYDIANRLLSANSNGSWEQYAYLAHNKRVWKRTNQNGNLVEQYDLYGVGGQKIATYTVNPQLLNEGNLFLAANQNTIDVYFGGRVIWQNGKAVLRDRRGSVMARTGDNNVLDRHDYFPYGEERTPSIGDRNKYGTYHRDQTGLDYADQRYYNSTIGRFLTSDPYEASGGANKPAIWGRGVYVHGDPVNFADPLGLDRVTVEGLFNNQLICTRQTDREGRLVFQSCIFSPLSDLISPDLKEGQRDDASELLNWVERHDLENIELNSRLRRRIASIDPNCERTLANKGLDLSRVQPHFWNSTRRGEKPLQVGDLAGPNARFANSGLPDAGWIPGQGAHSFAKTLEVERVGGFHSTTNNVVLHRGFYAHSTGELDWILLHEALHLVAGPDDLILVKLFNISTPDPDEISPLTAWLKNGYK